MVVILNRGVRGVIALGGLVVSLAACGSSAHSTAASSSIATTTTLAGTTSEPGHTSAILPATTSPPLNRYLVSGSASATTMAPADAQQKASDVGGAWEGMWTNDTLHTNGTVTAVVNVDARLHVSAVVAFIGPLLGTSGLPPLSLELDLSSFPKLSSLRFDDGHGNSLTITDQPHHTGVFHADGVAGAPTVKTIEVTITRSEDAAHPAPGKVDGTFTIALKDGTAATGSLHLAHR